MKSIKGRGLGWKKKRKKEEVAGRDKERGRRGDVIKTLKGE